jgi:hypothetical protein
MRSQNASPSSPANERKVTRSGGLQFAAAGPLRCSRRFSLNANQKFFPSAFAQVAGSLKDGRRYPEAKQMRRTRDRRSLNGFRSTQDI